MKGPIWIVVGALAVAGAFAAGRMSGGATAPEPGAPADGDRDVAKLEKRVEDLTRKLAEERARNTRGDAAPGRARAAAASAEETAAETTESSAASANASASESDAAVPSKFSLEGVTNADDASKRFMAFADAQFAKGPDGYAAILEALNTIWNERQTIEGLFGDEATATRHLYPWIRFLVEREGKVIDLSEHVFKTMAEKPEAFADVPDNDILEIFTEGVGVLLPGAVPEDRLARFRGYATKFLETPEAQQPKALRGVRSDIERLVTRFWSAPLTPEEALAKLKAGAVPPREIARLVRLVPREALAEIDVTALVEPLLREGNYDVFRVLSSIPADRLDMTRLDAALLDAMDAGRADGSFASMCVQRMNRRQWADIRPLIDRAYGMRDPAKTAATQMISDFLPKNLRPDRAYVDELLARSVVPEAVAPALKAAYGIK